MRRTRRRLEQDCMGKQVYIYEQARRMAARLRQQQHRVVTAYPCRYCQGWHVGHDWRQRRRRQQRPSPSSLRKQAVA